MSPANLLRALLQRLSFQPRHRSTFAPNTDDCGTHSATYTAADNPAMGWWAISGEALMGMLHRCHDGEDPDMVYAETYANSDHSNPSENEPTT